MKRAIISSLRKSTSTHLVPKFVLPILPFRVESFPLPCTVVYRRIRESRLRDSSIRSFNTSHQVLQNTQKAPHMMTALKEGDKFPDGVTFSYVPYTPESESITACGIPQNYDASKEWADKKVVLFAVPGAFTPGCSVRHLPGYIQNLDKIKGKGVDVVAVIAFNDAFVMSAWAKANGIKNDAILFMSDPETKFSKSIGWTRGERAARYAMIIDHGQVVYAENEPGREVTVSGADAVLAKL